jgi:sugar O-acyltransferase (sialic acid O-acetyltransferase NeuD family)
VARALQQIVLLGSGGFARETAALIESINAIEPTWDLLGFADDNPVLQGTHVSGLPVVGPIEWVTEREPIAVVACMGNPENYASRKHVVERIKVDPARYPTLVHPMASVGKGSIVGNGSILLAGAVLTADAHVGAHVSVMPHAVLTHDVRVKNFACLTAGVKLAGGVQIGEGAFIGAGALIEGGVSVGDWAQVGMGSIVRHDVPAGEVWFGAPARFRRKAMPAGRPHIGT